MKHRNALMRQSDLARYFEVSQGDVSIALSREGVPPEEWGIARTGQALIKLYYLRRNEALNRADRFAERMDRITQRASKALRTCADCVWSNEKKYDEPCCRCIDFSEWEDCEWGQDEKHSEG